MPLGLPVVCYLLKEQHTELLNSPIRSSNNY